MKRRFKVTGFSSSLEGKQVSFTLRPTGYGVINDSSVTLDFIKKRDIEKLINGFDSFEDITIYVGEKDGKIRVLS